ncbi:MAG: hypothetical protein SPD95_09865 [Candidatus Faecousia sp.]|nr:hypothetical protein [Candidatus Faecousia sp.]
MAKQICPSCGKPYNGRRCKVCLYENFSEELSHGLHTHTGEPLVIEDTARKPIPRRDPLGCDRRTKKRSVLPLILTLIVVAAGVGILSAILHSPVAESVRTIAELSEQGSPDFETTLYAEDGITITTNWKDGQEYGDGFSISLRNNTKKNLTLYANQVIVNGYLLDRTHFSCNVRKGHTGQADFSLDEEELAYSGIETVQTMSICLLAYDSDSYKNVAEIGPLYLNAKTIPDFVQSDPDQGDVLYEDTELRVVFQGYQPSSYDQEDVSQGKLLLYLENASEHPVAFYLQQAMVNEKEADLSFWCELPAQTRTVAGMHLFALEDMGLQRLEQITDLTLQLQAADPEDASSEWVSIGPLPVPLGES